MAQNVKPITSCAISSDDGQGAMEQVAALLAVDRKSLSGSLRDTSGSRCAAERVCRLARGDSVRG